MRTEKEEVVALDTAMHSLSSSESLGSTLQWGALTKSCWSFSALQPHWEVKTPNKIPFELENSEFKNLWPSFVSH